MKLAKKISGIILILFLFVAAIIPCVYKIKAVRMKNDYSEIYKNENIRSLLLCLGLPCLLKNIRAGMR